MLRRTLALAGAVGAVLVLASSASAAVFIRLATSHVHRSGLVRVVGNARGMPLYALPARKMPCIVGHYACPGALHRTAVPRRPFIFLGREPGRVSATYDYTSRAFTIGLPRALPADKYVVFVWCSVCGGSLIPAATSAFQPQMLDVRP